MMALEKPQSRTQKPNPTQKPREFSSEHKKECDNQGTRETNMEKFKEAVIKLPTSSPNKPLSENQNSIIQDQFNRFLSVLDTPDHPPYAWMIERALQELNEKGGSSEESISDFIRKEYDDLPWSHFTLLKYHLQALRECGNIILIKGKNYLLAGSDATVNLGKKRRRKQTRRNEGLDREIKRHKRGLGGEVLLQKEDQVHGRQYCMVEGLRKQSLEAEVSKNTPQQDGEHNEDDPTEIITPERPPGFEHGALDELSNLPVTCSDNPSQGVQPPELGVSAAEGLSGHREKNSLSNVLSAPETFVHQMLQKTHPLARPNGTDSQQRMNEEKPAKPSQKRPIECHSPGNMPESELTKSTAAISETKHVDLTGGKKVSRIVFKLKKPPPLIQAAEEKHLPCTMQEMGEELLQQSQLKCEGQKHLDDDALASSGLQQQLQEYGVSNKNELVWAVNRSEHLGFLIPAVKPSHEEKHAQEMFGIPDSSPTTSSLQQFQPQEHVILETSNVQEVKAGAANGSELQVRPVQAAKPSRAEHHEPEAIPGVAEGPTISSRSSICSKQSYEFLQNEFSELGASHLKESLPTSRRLHKIRRWWNQLLNLSRSQPENQAAVGSSRARKEVNHCIQVKKNVAQPQDAAASPLALNQADPEEFSKFPSSQMHPDIEPKNQTPKHPGDKRASQEKPSCRVLRPRPP